MTVVDLEPRTKPDPVPFERAEELAARVMAAAADVAKHESVFLGTAFPRERRRTVRIGEVTDVAGGADHLACRYGVA